jgi:hypothetical protein
VRQYRFEDYDNQNPIEDINRLNDFRAYGNLAANKDVAETSEKFIR